MQEFGDTANCRTQAWKTASHRLKHRPWNTLRTRRENEEVRSVKLAAHRLTSGYCSDELNSIVDA